MPRSSKTNDGKNLGRIERSLSLAAQVERMLRGAIQNQTFPGGRLPTIVQLAEQFGVSRETVRLAADRLEAEGLLVKHRRRGMFLGSPPLPAPLQRAPSQLLGYLQADYRAEAGETEPVLRGIGSLMFDGVLLEAGEAGYQMMVRSAKLLDLREAFEQLQAAGMLRGIIFASIGEEKLLRRVAGLGIPAVLLDHDLHLPNLSTLRSDSLQCAKLAVEHLVELGHRRIACILWRQADDLNPWFPRGYREAMRAAGLRCRRNWEISVKLTAAGAEEAVDAVMALSPRPTAAVCFHNTLARYLIEAAWQRGLRVPEDLSVIGGGGEEVFGLTCNQLDWHELGRQAMRMLQRAIEIAPRQEPEHHLAPYALKPGRTTARP